MFYTRPIITKLGKIFTITAWFGLCLPIASHFLANSETLLAWLIDLLCHWQWLWIASLILGCTLLAQSSKYYLLLLSGVIVPWLTAADYAARSTTTPLHTLRLASANVHVDNPSPAPLLAWLKTTQPDILILLEVSPSYAKALEKQLPHYPFQHILPANDPFGIAIFSKYPIQDTREVMDQDGIIQLEAQIQFEQRTIQVIAFHPMPPLSPHFHGIRNRKLQQLATRSQTLATIIAGDFNASPWSSAFSGLAKQGLHRTSNLAPTWPSFGAGILGIPIDQILVSKEWQVIQQEQSADIGSDHQAILVKLNLFTH